MVEKVTKSDLDAVEKRLKTYFDEELTSKLDMVEKAHKMQIKTLFSTIETQQQAMSLMEKQFNMKIGGIRGNLERKPRKEDNDDDVLWTFENVDELLKFANERGLKLKDEKMSTIPSIESEQDNTQLIEH